MRPFLLALLLSVPCAARAQTLVQIPAPPVPGARMPAIPIPARFYLPPGNGRVGAVILLHGCGGIGNGYQVEAWAARVVAWGYAALIPDSLTPRGRRTVCAPALQKYVTDADQAGDAIDAALWLRTRPRIDHRIAVVGFSHGGGAAVTVTRQQFQDPHPDLIRAAVDFYGPCRQPRLHGTTPLLVLAGTADTWGDPVRSCAAFGQQLRPNQPFQLVTYKGVAHAFDNDRLVRRREEFGHPLQYDALATADAIVKVRAFLAQRMGPP